MPTFIQYGPNFINADKVLEVLPPRGHRDDAAHSYRTEAAAIGRLLDLTAGRPARALLRLEGGWWARV